MATIATKRRISQDTYNSLVSRRNHFKDALKDIHSQKIAFLANERNLGESSCSAFETEEARIILQLDEVEEMLSNVVVVVSEEPHDKSVVGLGDVVTIELTYKDGEYEGEVETNTYTIVSFSPNPIKGEISPNSIVGKAIFGKKVDDIIPAVLVNGDNISIKIISKS